MIGFQHNHPDRQFVMGGMFHGKVGAGGGINNHIRSIQTKSGIKILMNDDEKSITIKDPSGNTWYMDGQGNIEVTAPENISISAGKSVSINAGQNININAGMNISASAVMNYTQMVGINYISTIAGNASHFITGKLMEMIEGDVHSETLKERNEISHQDIALSSEKNIHKNAQVELQNNSGENSKIH